MELWIHTLLKFIFNSTTSPYRYSQNPGNMRRFHIGGMRLDENWVHCRILKWSNGFPLPLLLIENVLCISNSFCLYTSGFLTKYQYATKSQLSWLNLVFLTLGISIYPRKTLFLKVFHISLDKSWIKFASYLFKSLTSIQDDFCWFSESIVIIPILLIRDKRFFTLLSFYLSSITSGSLSHSNSLTIYSCSISVNSTNLNLERAL